MAESFLQNLHFYEQNNYPVIVEAVDFSKDDFARPPVPTKSYEKTAMDSEDEDRYEIKKEPPQ